MRMYDLIMKKRNGEHLDAQEIKYIIEGYVKDEIPDYQMSAFLMAVYFQGMNEEETLALTMSLAESGERVDLSEIEGIKADKHSTGGVGDKTTLIIAPLVAACGLKVAKMSGRGLGHTGGTVDKLEAIPGFRTSIEKKEFFRIVNEKGLCVIGQSGNLAPGDKKLYALRDVTATVDSIPLIASSIMSKKLAAGSDCIVLDVKTGSGAFMKNTEDALLLAEEMVKIGENAGKRMLALITDMDIPLGKNIGNSLEIIEAIEVLKGEGPEDLTRVSKQLAAGMLFLAGKGDEKSCLSMVEEAIAGGAAFEKFKEMVSAQGGDPSFIENPEKFPRARYSMELSAQSGGYISHMDTEGIGIASVMLGAGREHKDSAIDYAAGIILHRKYGDEVREGERIATLYASEEEKLIWAKEKFLASIYLSPLAPPKKALILARVGKDGTKSDV